MKTSALGALPVFRKCLQRNEYSGGEQITLLHRVLGGGKTWPGNMGLGRIHFESNSLEVEGNRAKAKTWQML